MFKTLIGLVLMKGLERMVMEEYIRHPRRRDPISTLTFKYSLCHVKSCQYSIQFRPFTLLSLCLIITLKPFNRFASNLIVELGRTTGMFLAWVKSFK